MRVEGAPPFLRAEWHEEARVLEVAYEREAVLDDAMADETIGWLDAFREAHGGRFGLLVDAERVRDASFSYRQRFGAWFRAHASEVRMAIYHLTPFVRVMTILFAKATALDVFIARDREEAMRWLQATTRA
ncbi:MAG TPA: hypothetical protein VFH78_09465 [Candidatus Thermoplasmatota archaeon]|nr:hypothetical protein [Candidatus Thermoplasmatota archaeon]